MGPSAPAKQKQRIMVIDNNQQAQELLPQILQREGFEVLTTGSGQALKLLRLTKPDLVIMETKLPEAEELEILNRIREKSDVPVIMVSTRHEEKWLQTVLQHGADDFINRPFSTQVLTARIRAKLRRAGKAATRQPASRQ